MIKLIACTALVATVQAWSINAHLLVANIAQTLLEQKNPDALAAANAMLATLHKSDPDLTENEDTHSFVECATFADDVKYHGHAWQSDFHFQAEPWFETGSSSDYDVGKTPTRNLTCGIEDLTDWLSNNGKLNPDSYIYDYIQNRLYPGDEANAQSFALRLLIHYVGDIVQPLHNEARYNSAYLDGDKGGNTFPLDYHYGVDELHALWDEAIYTQWHHISRVSLPSI